MLVVLHTFTDEKYNFRMAFSDHKSWLLSLFHNLNAEVLLAGLAGGAASTLLLHPLDVLKIQLQVSENHSLAKRKVYRNMRDVMPNIYRNKGLLGFYQGVSPNLAGAACAWGLYFFIYNGLKNVSLQEENIVSLSLFQHLSHATVAGFVSLTLTNPIWVVKTRMVLQGPTQSVYTGLFNGLYKLVKLEGLRGMYSGYIPGIFGISHGVIQFVSYEKMKHWYYNHNNYANDVKLSVFPYIALSAISKVLAVTLTYPYQVVRSRLQDSSCNYNGSWDVIIRTIRNEGWKGFYKGIIPSLIRVTPACCITFVCYENIMHYFQQYKTF